MVMAATGRLRCRCGFPRSFTPSFALPSLAPCTQTVSETCRLASLCARPAMLSDCGDQWQKRFPPPCPSCSLCADVTSWSAFELPLGVTGSDESFSDMMSSLMLRSLFGYRDWTSFLTQKPEHGFLFLTQKPL